jgi:misacylated tRNA(Ala) deacylase
MTGARRFRDDSYLKSCTARAVAVSARGIEPDRTVLAPRGGGQLGDTGRLHRADGVAVRIVDARQGEGPATVVHVPAPDAPALAVGDLVTAELDGDRRYAHRRLHTALHVLSSVVVAPVTGGNIAADQGRLDFAIDPSVLDAAHIERALNALLEREGMIATVWITDAELDAQPELVKTMSVQPPRGAGRVRLLKIPGIDLQPCGGTHVRHLAEIGRIKVLRLRSEGKRNKRVEIGFA